MATLKVEARNKLNSAMVDHDLNLARIDIIPDAPTPDDTATAPAKPHGGR